MRCLRPLLLLCATACVGSAPPPPGPALGTAGESTTAAAPTDETGLGSSTTTPDPSPSTDGSTGPAVCDPPCAADETCIEGVCFDTLCDPPCPPDQACIEGVCFDMGDTTTTTTGEPPVECPLAVDLGGSDWPDCGPCLETNCCPELQACFGDETTMAKTECLQLNNCIAEQCAAVATQRELQACIDNNCSAYAASLQTWLAWQACAGQSCTNECS